MQLSMSFLNHETENQGAFANHFTFTILKNGKSPRYLRKTISQEILSVVLEFHAFFIVALHMHFGTCYAARWTILIVGTHSVFFFFFRNRAPFHTIFAICQPKREEPIVQRSSRHVGCSSNDSYRTFLPSLSLPRLGCRSCLTTVRA